MKNFAILFLIQFLFSTSLSLSAKDDPPEWVKNRHDARFSDASYLQAVGQAEIGKSADEAMAQAELMAKNQIAEQLRINIKSKFTTIKFEDQSGAGYREQALEELQASTQIALSGLKIESRFIDRKKKSCYALAVLDRKIAAEGMRSEIVMLKNGAAGALENAQGLMQASKPIQTISGIRRSYNLIIAADERELVLPILKTRNFSLENLPALPTTEQVLKQLQEAGGNIKIEIEKPNVRIQSKIDLPYQVLGTIQYGNQSLAEMGLSCSFVRGRGNARVIRPSDVTGQFEMFIEELHSAPNGDYQIELRPDISNLLLPSEQVSSSVWNEALKNAFAPAKLSIKKIELDLEDHCASAAEQLAARLSVSKDGFRLIPGNMTYAETGASSDFVAYLKDKIAGELALINNVQLIAPDKIAQTIRQAKESYRGAKRPDSPEILAELIDADGVLVGTYWDRQSELEFNLKIVERNSAATLSTAMIKLPKHLIPREMSFLPANYTKFAQANDVGNVKPAKDDLKIDVWTDRGNGAIYKSGDKLIVYVRASHDCFLYLIYHDADGNDILIYPNARQANNRILGGVIYQIPDARDTFDFVVRPPYGSELIKAIIASDPMPDLSGRILANGLKLLTGSLKDNLVRLRGIHVQFRQSGYAEASCVLTTVE